jgi:hypothetical protein
MNSAFTPAIIEAIDHIEVARVAVGLGDETRSPLRGLREVRRFRLNHTNPTTIESTVHDLIPPIGDSVDPPSWERVDTFDYSVR